MPTIRGQLSNLIDLIRGSKPRRRTSKLTGSQDQILPAGQIRRRNLKQLDIPEIPLRPIMFDHGASRSLLEMTSWSYEFSTCLRLLAQNTFQNEHGGVESWSLAPNTGLDSYTTGLIKDLQNRYCGKDELLGGEILETAVCQLMGYGDSFMELAIERDGSSYTISQTMYLPSFSTFIEEDEHGNLLQYRQQERFEPGDSDRVWRGTDLARILHFRAPGPGRYGYPPGLSQIEVWQDIKDAIADLVDAARSSAILPNLHIMPEDKGANYKNLYRAEYEETKAMGIVTDLYLSHGAKVEKLAAATPTLKPLIDHYLQLRYRMCLPGCPIFLIPGLGLEQGASKELGGQPALAYGRLISTVRSYLAKQIIWAIGVEVTLNKGYDFWKQERPKVRLEWPKFITQEMPGLQPGSNSGQQTSSSSSSTSTEEEEAKAQEVFLSVNGRIH